MRVRRAQVLRPAQVVALVMAPERNLGFVSVVESVVPGEHVSGRKVMIDARGEVLLAGGRAGRVREEVEGPVAGVRQSLKLQERQRLRAQQRFGNHVVGERAHAQRIFQNDGRLRQSVDDALEIPVADGRRRNQGVRRHRALRRVAGLPVEKEEGLVFPVIELRNKHRPANVGPELIAVQPGRSDGFARDGIVALRQVVVPVELPERAPQPVGAALGQDAYLAAGRPAVLRRKGAGFHLELRQRVHRRREGVRHGIVVHHLDAVQIESVGRVAAAVGRSGGGAVRGVRLPHRSTAPPHRDGTGGARLDPWNQLRQLDEVASVQGQLHDLRAIDHRAHRRILGLQQRPRCADVHAISHAAHFQGEVGARRLAHLHFHRLNFLGLETFQSRRQPVLASRQEWDGIIAGLIGSRLARDVGGQIDGADGHAAHGRARWIHHGPQQGRRGLLSGCENAACRQTEQYFPEHN